MAYVVADGPPGIDAVHSWAPASGTGASLNFWDVTAPAWPRVRIEQITGWRSLPESDDNREARTLQGGEIVYPSLLLGKTIVYEAEVRALDWVTLNGVQNTMVQAFGNMSDEGTMTVTPFSWIGGPVWTYTARCTALDFEPKPTLERNAVEPLRWPFAVTLRMSDPHFYTGGVAYL
jgi:hypothetical protein